MTKRIISVLLCAALALALFVPALAADTTATYKHVYIIGVDGSGAAWRDMDTPEFDRIFANGAYRYDAKTEYISTSAQNWGSILCGVAYDVHNFTNYYIEENDRSSDTDNNSIFYYVRNAMPDAELVSFNNWSPINNGIIENDLNVKKVNRSTDPLVVQSIINYADAGNNPTLMFVQLDNCDHQAHMWGGFSNAYYSSITKADMYLGMIYDALDRNGLMEDALFILVADHGETSDGHGGQTVEESSAVVAVTGKTVNKTTLGEGTRNRDVAAIALTALGIDVPAHMTAVVPENLFGEAHAVEVAPSQISSSKAALRSFCYFFVNLVEKIISIFA